MGKRGQKKCEQSVDRGAMAELPALSDATRCNGTALRKAMRRVSQLYDEVLAPCGLRSTQRSLLIHIARAERPAMGELADALVLDRSALAHNLKPLERDGFIEVVVDEEDRRSRRITLTSLGRVKLAESTELWERAQCRFEHVLGEKEARALRATLHIIASSKFEQAFLAAPDL
jgi:DNA-binding MarR family transcriptional regulator